VHCRTGKSRKARINTVLISVYCNTEYNISTAQFCTENRVMRTGNIISVIVIVIQVGLLGYFVNVSITTPIVSALKNYYI
jgi:hypothetical protein